MAALFGAGVAVFLIAPAPGLLPRLAMPLTLFTLLCFVNCTLISSWEREVDEVHGQTSLAVQYRGTAIDRDSRCHGCWPQPRRR